MNKSSNSIFGIPDVANREKAVKWWLHKVAKENGWDIPISAPKNKQPLSWLNEVAGSGHSLEFYTPIVKWIRINLRVDDHVQFDSRRFLSFMNELSSYAYQFDMTWEQEYTWITRVENEICKLYKDEVGNMRKTSLWLINKDYGGGIYVASDSADTAMNVYKKATAGTSDGVVLSIEFVKHFILVDEGSLKDLDKKENAS